MFEFFFELPGRVQLLIFVSAGILVVIILFVFLKSIVGPSLSSKEKLQIYLELDKKWNSPSMLESREKCIGLITDEILKSPDPSIKLGLEHSRRIVQFFDQLGIQVYQGYVPFSIVYSYWGSEILRYWDKLNYKYLVGYDQHKALPSEITPWVGFEYLANLCTQQKQKPKPQAARVLTLREAMNFILIILGILFIMAIGTFIINTIFGLIK